MYDASWKPGHGLLFDANQQRTALSGAMPLPVQSGEALPSTTAVTRCVISRVVRLKISRGRSRFPIGSGGRPARSTYAPLYAAPGVVYLRGDRSAH